MRNKLFSITGVILICIYATAGMFLHCSLDSLAGPGNTSETSNGIVSGCLYSDLGTPSAGTVVYLFPSDFDPVANTMDSIRIDTTDAQGIFMFTRVAAGSYTIEAVHLINRQRAYIPDITVRDSLIVTPADTLRYPGVIRVLLPEGSDPVNGYCYIPGTTIAGFIDTASGYAVLDSAPAGIISRVYYHEKESPEPPSLITESITVTEGALVTIAYSTWTYTQDLYLNTTPSGADVVGTVLDVPILIRLNNTNFTFTQANTDGSDIRFTKSDGTPLPYEIELWDSHAGQAAVWVQVDTIYGNNNTQFITMFWGNDSSCTTSRSEAVFDTAKGFQAVWHMEPNSFTQTPDATANGFDGTLFRMTDTATVDGIIGKALYFDGDTSYVEVLNSKTGKLDFPEDGTYSLSAWVYLDTLVLGQGYVFISKSDYQYNLEVDREHNYWHMSEYHDGEGLQRVGTPAAASVWTQVTGVRNGTEMLLYVNGELANDTSWTDFHPFVQDTLYNVCLGRIGTYLDRFMKGILDELRISNVAYSPDWIKLCYMNQRSDDKLVVFHKK